MEATKIGVDLDKTLTQISRYNVNIKLPWWFFIGILLLWPNKKMVKVLRGFEKDGKEIIIVSARPRQLRFLTKIWLKLHKIPSNQVFCVGLGEGEEKRKLRVIQEVEIEVFVDDDGDVVKFLREHSIKAYLTEELLE